MSDLEAFYDEYVDKVYKYFYINCLNRHTAEDLTSHTFLSFLDKHKEGEIADSKKYLYAIMRNVWMDHLRKKYQETIESIESIEDFEAFASESVNSYETKNIKQRAEVFIDRLPSKQKEIAKMRLLQEMTIKEIAKKLDKKMSYVKTTQNRAIKSLKKMLDQPEIGGVLS